MAAAIVIIWLTIRGCRGDKQEIARNESDLNEIHFDENFKKTREEDMSGRMTGRMLGTITGYRPSS